MLPTSMSIEAKRQLIYASLLRYGPTSVPLRDRIIDRLTIGGLLGSNQETAFGIGLVASKIFAGSRKSLRLERVQESLQRLIASGFVMCIIAKRKNKYFLSQKGIEQANEAVANAEDIFDASFRRVLSDVPIFCSYDAAVDICRSFLVECFGRFGVQMAKTVTGQLQPGDLIHQADVRAAFDAAIQGKGMSSDVSSSLYARCMELLKSMHPDDVRLRFLIAQSYYFAQLAEYGSSAFNPLMKESYSGAVYLLDTNVLLMAVLDESNRRVFDELLRISAEMHIQLRVTSATINEVLSVFDDHKIQLALVLRKAPEKLVKLAADDLTDAYIDARSRSPELTVVDFFDGLSAKLSDLPAEWNIELLSLDESAMLKDREFPEAAVIIQEEALRARGRVKAPVTLRHDVAHYALILDERESTPNTWFLTRDRGLPVAASRLALKGSPPFTFDLIGLLETVSPFVSSEGPDGTLSEALGRMLSQNLVPRVALFNMHELKLLVQMHEDVLSTPEEQLVRAVDYVKNSVLHGKSYDQSEYYKVALGLKSFIASSADEQRAELEAQKAQTQAELEKQTRAAAEEREQRKMSDKVIEEKLRQIEDLEEIRGRQEKEMEDLRAQSSAQAEQITTLKAFDQRVKKGLRVLGWCGLGISLILMCVLAGASGRLSGYIQWRADWKGYWNELHRFFLFLAAAIPIVTTAFLIRWRDDWQLPAKAAIIAIVVIIATLWCNLIDSSAPIYAVATMASLIGTALAALFQKKP